LAAGRRCDQIILSSVYQPMGTAGTIHNRVGRPGWPWLGLLAGTHRAARAGDRGDDAGGAGCHWGGDAGGGGPRPAGGGCVFA
jgi:hypothetical protein